MEKTNNLEERISKLERRVDRFDKIWFWGRRIGIVLLLMWAALIFIRIVFFIFN